MLLFWDFKRLFFGVLNANLSNINATFLAFTMPKAFNFYEMDPRPRNQTVNSTNKD